MIPAPTLEIAVLLWGLILLLAESFVGRTDRRGFAIAGIAGLFVMLVASFFLAPPPTAAVTGFWSFYAADPLAIFSCPKDTMIAMGRRFTPLPQSAPCG